MVVQTLSISKIIKIRIWITYKGRKISSSQIKTYVHEIIDKIKVLADPEFANRVTSKLNILSTPKVVSTLSSDQISGYRS